jgi:hypothetical protein
MTDVVVELPVTVGEESHFGAYLNQFMEQRTVEAERMAETADAPYLMVRSDPAVDPELKLVIFQERRAARDFSSGWAKARRSLIARAS